eukprot:TRINITY_DN12819_c0_g1_i1.p1 TRINITY_DN12819_c0_g1~~TRINITY_DN12819_c0_g1_i1.p1  ORF type:complete len:100 (+),score=8.70 TRINITY_DN12819_c0_g1_i1:48-347(+)
MRQEVKYKQECIEGKGVYRKEQSRLPRLASMNVLGGTFGTLVFQDAVEQARSLQHANMNVAWRRHIGAWRGANNSAKRKNGRACKRQTETRVAVNQSAA